MKICEVAQDAYRLLSSAYDAISYSTPHLYVSAMIWLPEKSSLRPLLDPHFENQHLLLTGRHKEWHRTRWMNAMGGPVWTVAFSPDGRHVAASSFDETICIWEARTGLIVAKLKGHTDRVLGIAFSPDGKRLVSGSRDGTARIWDVDTGLASEILFTGHTDTVESVCYSPDGESIASRSYDETVQIWDSGSGREIKKLPSQSGRGSVVYSPDGRKLACCGREGIKVYKTETGELLGEGNGVGHVSCVAYSPDGKYLVYGSEYGAVQIWDGATLAEFTVLTGHTAHVFSVAFSPDGKELLSASADATLIRWDMASFQMTGPPFRAHEATILSAAYSPVGRSIATGSADNSIRLWDVDSISNADSSARLSRVLAAACSPNGKAFASALADGSVRIHDVHSGAVLQTLSGHLAAVGAVAYSRDSKLLATGSDDCTVIIWDASRSVKRIAESLPPDASSFPSGRRQTELY